MLILFPFSWTPLLLMIEPSLGYLFINVCLGLEMKPLDGSRPISRLPNSPSPPTSQQEKKIKQEPKTPIAPKKTQVCTHFMQRNKVSHLKRFALFSTSMTHVPFLNFLSIYAKKMSSFFLEFEIKEHGFVGQPCSQTHVCTNFLTALIKWQLWAVQTSRHGERGEGETAESPGRAGQEGARNATVSGRDI